MTSQETAGSAQGAVEGGLDDPSELEPEQGTLTLAGPEDTHTRADWEAAAAAVLRKARRLGEDEPDDLVWERLSRPTLDGVRVPVLGVPEDARQARTRGRPARTGDWDVRGHLKVAEPAADNEQLLVDLAGGVTSLWLEVAATTDLDALLDGVLLDVAPVVLDAPDAPRSIAEAFLAAAGDAELAPGTNLGVPATAAEDDLVAVASAGRQRGVLAVVVDGTRVHDAGASDAQELGWSVHAGARALRVLSGAGMDLDAAAGLLEFRYAVADEQFPAIAKLRAARRLWARVLELSGVSGPVLAAGQRQHAVTSRPMMSRYDPYVNLLRTTVAAFAAGVGGAEAVTVLPFDSPLGRPEGFGRRLARNTGALLISESHLARVTDPAGGAFAVERLTDDVAHAAWEVLGRLDDGEPLEPMVEATAAARDEQVATRTRPITGLTEFPDLAGAPPPREPDGGWERVRPYGAAFEAMRDDPPSQPVFLATMGPVAAHTARATFATNLLAAGGVAVDVAGATADAEALAEVYDGQAVACLAGSDAAYREWGQAAVAALREAGARHLVLAGRPDELDVDDSCAMGVDALAFLTRTREALR